MGNVRHTNQTRDAVHAPVPVGCTRVTRTGRSGRSGSLRIAPVFWMTALALFVVTMGVLPAAGDPVPPRSSTSIAVRVSPADTLWSIAAAHRLPGMSTAQMVRLIADTNELSGPGLCTGAVLRVPAELASESAYAQVSASTPAH